MKTNFDLLKMKTNFDLLKNGKVSVSVWANPQTKEIYPANKNSFGHNAEHHHGNAFYARYGKNLKKTQGRADYRKFYYSAKTMESIGFQLVWRGEQPLW